MAQFNTDHILTVITQDALRDHEANRRVIEALGEFRLGNQEMVVATILEIVLRQMGQSSHGRDLVVALVDRFTDEARARSLAEIQLTAAGFEPQEIEETIREFPECFSPEAMHQELIEAGAI